MDNEELKLEMMRKRLKTLDRSSMIPDVEGHKLTLQEWVAFSEFSRTGSGRKAAKVAGVHTNTMYKWMKSDWFKNLQRDHVEAHLDSFYMKMAGASKKIFDAYMKVIDGKWGNDKTINAVVKAIELFMRMGKGGTEPVLNSRPFIEMHKTINNIQINSDKLAIVWNKMDDDERHAFHMTGDIPSKYRVELSDSGEQEGDIELTEEQISLLEGYDEDDIENGEEGEA